MYCCSSIPSLWHTRGGGEGAFGDQISTAVDAIAACSDGNSPAVDGSLSRVHAPDTHRVQLNRPTGHYRVDRAAIESRSQFSERDEFHDVGNNLCRQCLIQRNVDKRIHCSYTNLVRPSRAYTKRVIPCTSTVTHQTLRQPKNWGFVWKAFTIFRQENTQHHDMSKFTAHMCLVNHHGIRVKIVVARSLENGQNRTYCTRDFGSTTCWS